MLIINWEVERIFSCWVVAFEDCLPLEVRDGVRVALKGEQKWQLEQVKGTSGARVLPPRSLSHTLDTLRPTRQQLAQRRFLRLQFAISKLGKLIVVPPSQQLCPAPELLTSN